MDGACLCVKGGDIQWCGWEGLLERMLDQPRRGWRKIHPSVGNLQKRISTQFILGDGLETGFCQPDWTMEENKDLGKVRPEHVKRLARQLAEQFPDRFTKDFEKNKELVETLTDVSSTKFRNRVAGYIIQLVRERRVQESREVNVKDASWEKKG